MIKQSLKILLALLALARPLLGFAQEPDSKEPKAQSIDELLLFFPTKYPKGNWQPEGLKYEDIFFAADDGTKLHGWYCPVENPRAVILIAHGNAGHVASRAEWLRYLQKSQYSTFLFDYRGYGRSEGAPTVEGALQDARAARAKLRELAKVKDSDLILMGESLGGAMVIHLAVESAPRALIVQSSFSSLRDVADVHFPRLSWVVPKNKLDSVSQMARYAGPLLQSHGTADRTIPYSLSQKLFAAAPGPKQFFAVPGADHNDWITDAYLEQMKAFIAKVSSSN